MEGKAWASATVTYYAPASVSLASSKGSDTYGDSVTFTATVAGTNNATPGGRVELYIDGVDTQQSAAVSGSGSTATAAFTLSNLSAGTHAVTVAYSGDGVNYPSGTSNAVTQTVGKKTLTVSATGVNRSYDGTTTATVTLSDNRVSGDPLTESYTSASFANADAGNGIAVNVTGISVTGSAAGNYVLGNTTATTTANIIPAALSYTIGSDSQSYGSAANLAKDLPGTITTGVNGENLFDRLRQHGGHRDGARGDICDHRDGEQRYGSGEQLRGEPDERDVDGERGGIRLWDQRVGGAERVCGGVADDDLHGIARLRVAGGGAGTGPWDAERDDDEQSVAEHEFWGGDLVARDV